MKAKNGGVLAFLARYSDQFYWCKSFISPWSSHATESPFALECALGFKTVSEKVRAAKQQRRRAERQWLKTGLTIHKQIYIRAKKCVTRLVHAAKTSYFCSMIRDSLSCKQLFRITNQLLGIKTKTKQKAFHLPTAFLRIELPQYFRQSLTERCKLSETTLTVKHHFHPVVLNLASTAGLSAILNLLMKTLWNKLFSTPLPKPAILMRFPLICYLKV